MFLKIKIIRNIFFSLIIGLLLTWCYDDFWDKCNNETKILQTFWEWDKYVICDWSIFYKKAFPWAFPDGGNKYYEFKKLKIKETDNFNFHNKAFIYTDSIAYINWTQIPNIKFPIKRFINDNDFYFEDQEWIKLNWEPASTEDKNFTYINTIFSFDDNNIFKNWKIYTDGDRKTLRYDKSTKIYRDSKHTYSIDGVTYVRKSKKYEEISQIEDFDERKKKMKELLENNISEIEDFMGNDFDIIQKWAWVVGIDNEGIWKTNDYYRSFEDDKKILLEKDDLIDVNKENLSNFNRWIIGKKNIENFKWVLPWNCIILDWGNLYYIINWRTWRWSDSYWTKYHFQLFWDNASIEKIWDWEYVAFNDKSTNLDPIVLECKNWAK